MKLCTEYQGNQEPFEGDRILTLRSLPVGASVVRASLTLTPVEPPIGNKFEEILDFSQTENPLGTRKTEGTGFVEVDFYARRTLASVNGSGLTGAQLQIDLGGAYVDLSDRGTIKAPNDGSFSLPANGQLPALTVNRFKLTHDGNPVISQITIRSVPTNVSVRLGQLPPFWTYLGELASAQTSPDFAELLNTIVIAAASENGFYIIPIGLHSDTIARLNVKLKIEYVMQQRVLPSHLPEITVPYSFSTLPGVDEALSTATLPRGAIAIAGKTSGQIRGEFQPTRIALGMVGEDPISTPSQKPQGCLTVSPQVTLAQPLQSDREIAVTAIDLSLANTAPGLAGLQLVIQADADGKPSGEVLLSANVLVGKPLPNQSNWGSATLPAPFRVLVGERYWLVLQSRVGQAFCSVVSSSDAQPGLQSSTDNGFSWRMATIVGQPAPLAALFRLRNTPDQFTVPVQVQIGKGMDAVRRRLDEFAPLGRIEFRFDFATELGQYLSSNATASPCGTGDRLVNGNFANPPADDATRKLFGVGAARAEVTGSYYYSSDTDSDQQPIIEGTIDLSRGVNLSVERFITLALDNGKPIRIDCSGKEPAQTQLSEIVQKINAAVRRPNTAFVVEHFEPRITALGVRSNAPTPNQTTSVELLPWCSTELPKGWQGTTRQIFRLKLPNSNRIITVLAAPSLLNQSIASNLSPTPLFYFPTSSQPASFSETQAATLFQRVSCSAECTYLLQFFFGIIEKSSAAPPRWEVNWLDQSGDLIRTDGDDIPISTRLERRQRPPRFQEVRVTAPENATQAEIRFTRSAPGGLWLASVAFVPTLEALDNGSFKLQSENRVPVGWQYRSGLSDASDHGEILRGNGSEDAVLVQTVTVIPEATYKLQITASLQTRFDPESTAARSRVELQWLGASAPIILVLEGQDFPLRAWMGTAPKGVTSAEIRLTQPQGRGDLLIETISFSRVDTVSVPLIFLAEAPGQLTISDLRVAYDLPEPPALTQPIVSTASPPRLRPAIQVPPPAPLAPEVPPPQPKTPTLLPDLPIPSPTSTGTRTFSIPFLRSKPLDQKPVVFGTVSLLPFTQASFNSEVVNAPPAPQPQFRIESVLPVAHLNADLDPPQRSFQRSLAIAASSRMARRYKEWMQHLRRRRQWLWNWLIEQ